MTNLSYIKNVINCRSNLLDAALHVGNLVSIKLRQANKLLTISLAIQVYLTSDYLNLAQNSHHIPKTPDCSTQTCLEVPNGRLQRSLTLAIQTRSRNAKERRKDSSCNKNNSIVSPFYCQALLDTRDNAFIPLERQVSSNHVPQNSLWSGRIPTAVSHYNRICLIALIYIAKAYRHC